MVHKNYRRGKDMDIRCAKDLQGAGWWSQEAHASKGIFDVVAVKGRRVLFIQVKRSKRNIVSVAAVASDYREDIMKLTSIPQSSDVNIELWLWLDSQWELVKGKRKMKQNAGWRMFIIDCIGGICEVTHEQNRY